MCLFERMYEWLIVSLPSLVCSLWIIIGIIGTCKNDYEYPSNMIIYGSDKKVFLFFQFITARFIKTERSKRT